MPESTFRMTLHGSAVGFILMRLSSLCRSHINLSCLFSASRSLRNHYH